MAEVKLARRNFLKGAGAAGAAGAALATGLDRVQPGDGDSGRARGRPDVWHTLNATEAAFISAAVDTLIPADELTPSGSDVGLAVFIDRQLAGAFGNGARLYRQGPFLPGKPEHGYQLALTPREFFRAGIEATNEWTQKTYRQGFRPPERGRARRGDEGAGRRQARVRRLQELDVLRPAVAAHHGRVLRRSDLWRQSRQGGVEDDRLPGSARPAIAKRSRPISTRNTTPSRNPSRTFRKGSERWSPYSRKSMRSLSAWAGRGASSPAS